jgi:hypothetical protein
MAQAPRPLPAGLKRPACPPSPPRNLSERELTAQGFEKGIKFAYGYFTVDATTIILEQFEKAGIEIANRIRNGELS